MVVNNPFAGAGLAWDLGGGWGFSNVVGGQPPVDNEFRLFGHNIWAFNDRAALSYTGNEWHLTAHAIYGAAGKDLEGRGRLIPDWFNYELTAIKSLGSWQIGVVAFCSTDLEEIAYGPRQCGDRVAKCEQAQFAVGGLLGYAFPGVTTQLWATSDVWTQNYLNSDGSKSYEKRVWTRVIVPLWIAPKEEAPFK